MDGPRQGTVRTAHDWTADRVRARTADMFVEVQRADGKATVLCGVAGGLLTVNVAALPALAGAGRAVTAALGLACGVLAVALCAALSAIRPVVPRANALTGLEGVRPDGNAEGLVAALGAMSREDQLCIDARRLSLLAALARRKFQAIKVAVDLIVAALGMAGIGLLITYIAT